MTLINTIQQSCLRYLALREHSQQELLQKLLTKGFSQEDSLPVLNNLARQDWQSDLRYAQSYARYRLNKGYGAVFIRYQLQQKGVDSEIINSVLATVSDDWFSVLQQVYEKKYGDNSQLTRKDWAKRSRFLMQRGFESELIKRLFNRLIK
ncbi:MAG: regulatory protein RecX [Methylococcaceae bacterium]